MLIVEDNADAGDAMAKLSRVKATKFAHRPIAKLRSRSGAQLNLAIRTNAVLLSGSIPERSWCATLY